ncbi:MAG: gliding motility-associated C-terminal domain-containing protein, partial [Crocinitomicaceae bacterium]
AVTNGSAAWSGGSGTYAPDNLNPTANYTPSAAEVAAGTVTLTLTVTGTQNECNGAQVSEDVTLTISLNSNDLSLDPSYTYCEYDLPDSIAFDGDLGYTVNWYLDNSKTNLAGTNVIKLPTETTTYFLTQSINGECESSPVEVEIELSSCLIDTPTAFTPDGDNYNDRWIIPNLDEYYPNNIVRIYNRWGELLYQSEAGQYNKQPWDGYFNNKVVPVASYYYFIEYNNGTGKTLNGVVSVIIK